MIDSRNLIFLLLLLLQRIFHTNAITDEELFAMYNGDNKAFARTKTGILIPRITGTLSGFCSVAVIFVILRSSSKLTTTYHRIMFSLSIVDFFSSFAAALTTLPMPKYGYDRFIDSYSYEGKRIGNYATCRAQGFSIYIGTFISFTYHVSLWVFYVCTIRYHMEPKVITKYVEPWLHIVSIVIPTGIGLVFLFRSYFNPNDRRPYCGITIYPVICVTDETVECIAGSKKDSEILHKLNISLGAFILFGCAITVIGMILIYQEIYTAEKSVREQIRLYESAMSRSRSYTVTQNDKLLSAKSDYEKTKIITKECASYLLLWILTWIFVILDIGGITNEVLVVLYLIFTPLQGFWSCIIFCHGKVNLIRRAHQDCTYFRAVRLIFTSTEYPDLLISNLTLLKEDICGPEEYTEPNTPKNDSSNDLSSGISFHKSRISKEPSGTSLDPSEHYISKTSSSSCNLFDEKHSISDDLSYDEVTIDDGRRLAVYSGSSHNSRVSAGALSNDLSLFGLSSNLSVSLSPLDEERSGGDSFNEDS